MVSVDRIEVQGVVVRSSCGASVCEEIKVTVVWFWVFYYRKTSKRGVGVDVSVVGVYDRLRV